MLASPMWRMTPDQIANLTDYQIAFVYLKPTFDYINTLASGIKTGNGSALASSVANSVVFDPDNPPVSREAWMMNYLELGASPESCEKKWEQFLIDWRATCESRRQQR